jgi:putative colanic acid biosynthesis acetyltransferase WcaF
MQRARPTMNLAAYQPGDAYSPGRGLIVQLAWYVVSAFIFESKLFPVSSLKRSLLRLFGARIGAGVVIKPDVRIKFPWRLSIGDHTWIGESAWLDNLAAMEIGSNACISQGVYLCTGSHDAYSERFELMTKPIVVEDGAWLAAKSVVLPGVTIGRNAIVAAGAVVTASVAADSRVGGVPARTIGGSQ